MYHCWFIENLTFADDTAQLPKELDCRRYVEHTKNKWGITIPHLSILGFEIGGGGFEIEPKVLEAAGREALILDIAQHHYCEEMNRAIENEDLKRYEEVERERDKTIKKLTSLTEQKTGKELKEYVSQNYEPIKSMAVGKGSGDAMVELDKAYIAASPYLQVHGDVVTGTQEVGIKVKGGGEIHAGRDVIGIQKVDNSVTIGTAKVELSDEQFERWLELQKNLQTVNTEELTAKIKPLEEEIGTKDAEKAEALVVAGNKALELGKERQEDREFERAVREFKDALKYLPQSSEAAGDVYINLASAYAYLYKWDEALDAYKKAEEIGKELNRKPLLALAYGGMGTINHNISRYDKAIGYYKQSLAITREVGDRQSEGVILNNIGEIYRAWGKYDQAIGYHKQSLDIRKEVGDRQGEGAALNNIGGIYQDWGKYDQALEYYEQSLDIRKEVGDRQGEGVVLNNIGLIYRVWGRYDKAIGYFEQSLDIRKEVGDRRGGGATLSNIGGIYQAWGKYDQAIGYHKQSLDIRKEVGDRQGEGAALNNIGGIYQDWGKYDQALEYYEQSLDIRKEVGDRQGEGVVLNNIGLIYRVWGRYDKAIGYFEQSLDIRKEVGDRQGEGVVLNNIGLIYYAWGRYGQALEYFEQSLAIKKEVGNRRSEGVTLLNIAKTYEKQGRIQEAVDNLEEVVRIDEATKNPRLTQDRAYLERLKGYYENGQLLGEYNYKDGKQEGITKVYYKSGEIKYIDTYKNGTKINRKKYDKEGKLEFEQDYLAAEGDLYPSGDPLPQASPPAREKIDPAKEIIHPNSPADGKVHALTTSRIFHRPDCSAVKGKTNLAEFGSRGKAIKAGAIPCKSCNP